MGHAQESKARHRQSLKTGGVAVDDYSDQCWTLQEIESDLKVDGLGFFDFRGHYEQHYQT
ncbi:hypothetical protein [Catenulispora pinisilvae]|uniref:hypothetical protein n=1 Tax=Catenulispora pinisilvae TaxID=2705253 RepID=UPI0018923B51|nr:hypothetical protein [Catenulispora pinisilvae]